MELYFDFLNICIYILTYVGILILFFFSFVNLILHIRIGINKILFYWVYNFLAHTRQYFKCFLSKFFKLISINTKEQSKQEILRWVFKI